MILNSTRLGFIASLFVWPLLVSAGTHAELTGHPSLIIRNMTGRLSQERFQELARETENTLASILEDWSAKPRTQKFGKIRVEFYDPLERARYSSRYATFQWSKENGRRARIVRVFGADIQPQEMAHKLTHAIFPNPDKLIRNMMGIYSETRFGNPDSFPMCGFSTDTWVQALLELDSLIPLDSLGPDHSDWGMEFRNKRPVVRDRTKQHAAYAEAGSFGEHMIQTYGIDNMKEFNRLSRQKNRPWKDVFGSSLRALEKEWIGYLKTRSAASSKEVALLKRLRREDPGQACNTARSIASRRK